jgi:hypothetical protein
VQGGDAGRRGDLAGPENACLWVGERGGLHDGAGGAGEGDGVQPTELDRDPPSGQVGAAFGDADQPGLPKITGT